MIREADPDDDGELDCILRLIAWQTISEENVVQQEGQPDRRLSASRDSFSSRVSPIRQHPAPPAASKQQITQRQRV